MDQFIRTKMLISSEKTELLHNSKVLLFGVGGVGSYVAEAISRSGIGYVSIVDNDTVSLSNLNRQLIALHSTQGKYKVDVMKERMLDINPSIKVDVHKTFYLPENSSTFDFSNFDYIIDAVDTVSAKISIIEEAKKASVPVISSMGTGNKLNPTMLEVADISKTSVCPLAKVMRYELKKRNIKKVKVVYSKELPITPLFQEETAQKAVPGSVSFVPSVAGLIIASEVIKDLIGGNQ